MDYNELISDEHYKTAAENGISKINVNNRVYNCGWRINDAITSPLQKGNVHRFTKEVRELAKLNGVSNATMYYRVDKKGMDEMTAATTPVLSKAEAARKNQQSQWKHTTEEIQTLRKDNDIAYNTFHSRVKRYGLSVEAAATIPTKRAKKAII